MAEEKFEISNEEDVTALIEKHSESVRNICKKYFLVGGNQEDLFQEGMIGFLSAVKAFNKEHGGINSETFKQFALMCAKRQILDAIKHANRKKNRPLNDYISIDKTSAHEKKQIEMQIEAYGLNPETRLIEQEEKEEQLSEVDWQLTAFEKKVLWQYLEGKSYSQIAEEIGKDIKSVDNSIQRIKRKLKAGK